MRDFPDTAMHACVCRDGEGSKARDFPVTAWACMCACVCRDGEQTGCVTFKSQLCMHVCALMGRGAVRVTFQSQLFKHGCDGVA